ncbi:MAG: histidine kinase, partial [Phenylobacterium sp.]|nr:histidine kinase [Phenylobacterium sp.]
MPNSAVAADISPDATSRRRIRELEAQLVEARETLDAIRNGEVDAVVVGAPDARRIYTLENADRSYRLLIEQMAEGAVMLSADAVVLYANAALAALLDLPAERVLGQRFKRFVSDGDRAAFESLLLHGGTSEISLRKPGGASFPARLSLGALATDAGPVMCGVITDLTHAHAHAQEIGDARSRLAVEDARREMDERYRLILESATDFAILSTDFEGQVTIWNSGAANILGWQADEIIGGPAPTIWSREDRAAGMPQQEMATALQKGRAEAERWHLRKDGSRFWANGLMMPLRNQGGDAIGFLKILRDRTEQRRAAENQQILINELNHRVKNTLATVQSIATQTLRTAATPEEAREALEDRLIALSRAHDVLTRENWECAELSEIVGEALAAYYDRREDRIHIRGPEVRLPPRVALALSMALHELATNAVKYGALSNTGGEVSIDWTFDETAEARRLSLRWTEQGGPPVEPPRRQGFGSRLIQRTLASELGGEVTMEFAPAGV